MVIEALSLNIRLHVDLHLEVRSFLEQTYIIFVLADKFRVKRLLIVYFAQMIVKMTLSGKSNITAKYLTLVGLLTCMNSEVCL